MNYTVSANGEKVTVYGGNVFPKPYNRKEIMEYAIITVSDETVLKIVSQIKVHTTVVRPLSLGIIPVVCDDEILITIKHPVSFSLEINGNTYNNILIIANSNIEYEESNNRQIYFGKGEHEAGIIRVEEDNTTIYIEEGAYVHGKIHAENCSNLRIFGGGIISMERVPWEVSLTGRRAIDVLNCKNVRICDIVIHDSVDWSLRLSGCDNGVIKNVKIIGSRGNSDGIDICGSRNIDVSCCFLRVWDDALVVKALDTGNVENVAFRNCIVWNDFARPMEVGVELRADSVSGVLFSDIDVIHSSAGYPIMGIHHGDRATVSDITFEKIRIEEATGAQIFDVRIADSVWNRDNKKGNIRNIKFSDIDVRLESEYVPAKSRLQGFSEENDIRGVSFHNIRYSGQTAVDIEGLNLLVQDYVSDISVSYDGNINSLLTVKTYMDICKPFALDTDGMYKGKIKVTTENSNNEAVDCEFNLHISPVNTAVYDRAVIYTKLKPNEKFQKIYDVALPAGKYCAFVNSVKPNIISDWKYISLDLVICKNQPIEESPVYTFSNYYGIVLKGVSFGTQDNNLIISADFDRYEGAKLVVYTAEPIDELEGEVKFTVEETDFGEALAVIKGKHGFEQAPQLRCPAEIVYVFKNEPKVKKIVTNEFCAGELISVPFSELELPNDCKNFWMELSLEIPETKNNRYPLTLFHSVMPNKLTHMFANVIIKESE